MEIQSDEGNYYCDCDAAFINTAYQGLYCEHEATEYCSYKGTVSRTSFCTNGGKCLAKVGENDAHLGCECPNNYEGDHCQFVKGTQPEGWPYTKEASNESNAAAIDFGEGKNGELSGGAVFGIVAGVVVVVIAGAFFVRRAMVRKGGQRHAVERSESGTKGSPKIPVTENNLDPDGGRLPQDSSDLRTASEEKMAEEEESEII